MFASLGHVLSFLPTFPPRAFKINELKAEVANHLAVLEKRVEREWSFLFCFFFPFFPLSTCTFSHRQN